MVFRNCADVIIDIPRVDNLKNLGVHFGTAGVHAAVNWQKRKVKCQREVALLRSLEYHKGVLPVSTIILIA